MEMGTNMVEANIKHGLVTTGNYWIFMQGEVTQGKGDNWGDTNFEYLTVLAWNCRGLVKK